jgi:hypothetical protein
MHYTLAKIEALVPITLIPAAYIQRGTLDLQPPESVVAQEPCVEVFLNLLSFRLIAKQGCFIGLSERQRETSVYVVGIATKQI